MLRGCDTAMPHVQSSEGVIIFNNSCFAADPTLDNFKIVTWLFCSECMRTSE